MWVMTLYLEQNNVFCVSAAIVFKVVAYTVLAQET